MTFNAASSSTLRQLAMRVRDEALEFMRIAICAAETRIQVWHCVRLPFSTLLRREKLRIYACHMRTSSSISDAMNGPRHYRH